MKRRSFLGACLGGLASLFGFKGTGGASEMRPLVETAYGAGPRRLIYRGVVIDVETSHIGYTSVVDDVGRRHVKTTVRVWGTLVSGGDLTAARRELLNPRGGLRVENFALFNPPPQGRGIEGPFPDLLIIEQELYTGKVKVEYRTQYSVRKG